jgi:zinc finger protein 830
MCLICGTAVKHASAWEGHLGSKAHRTNVIRQREEERLEREQSKIQALEESEENADQDEEEKAHIADPSVSSSKRKTSNHPVDEHAEKRRRVEEKTLPTDFFSDPSRAPALLSDDPDKDDSISETSRPQPQPDVAKVAIDLEYERFQRELTKTTDSLDMYNRATIVAEPVVAPTSMPGFPITDAQIKENEIAGPTEEEIRQKREQEDKELIMDRLLEEERAQEDADTRVLLLKNRVELLRKKRQEARDKKAMSNTS